MEWKLFGASRKAHTWAKSEDGGQRICVVCAERQAFVPGDELVGLYWETTHAGREEAHSGATATPPQDSVFARANGALTRLRARLFPRHDWATAEDGMSRNCRVCDQQEELDIGGDLQGPTWLIVQRGKKRSPVVVPPVTVPTAAPSASRVEPAILAAVDAADTH